MIFSGGVSTPAVLANTARIAAQSAKKRIAESALKGGAEGTIAGVGSAEGSLEERFSKPETTASALIGAAARPGTEAVLGGAKNVISGLTRRVADTGPVSNVLGRLSTAQAAELQRIIDESGKTLDEIIFEIDRGKIPADVSPEIAMSLRAIYNTAGVDRGS